MFPIMPPVSASTVYLCIPDGPDLALLTSPLGLRRSMIGLLFPYFFYKNISQGCKTMMGRGGVEWDSVFGNPATELRCVIIHSEDERGQDG